MNFLTDETLTIQYSLAFHGELTTEVYLARLSALQVSRSSNSAPACMG